MLFRSPVTVLSLVVPDTVEAQVLEMQRAKAALFAEAFDAGAGGAPDKVFSWDDLRKFFS